MLTVLIWAVVLFAVLVSGRVLPTWMFLNSLQLMTHVLLCKVQLGAQSALFIKQFSGIARFNLMP